MRGTITPEEKARAAARGTAPACAPDPMDELTSSATTTARTPPKAKGHPRRALVLLTVPMSPRPDEPATKELLVYESRHGALFVQAEDLPWLLHYLYEETQGGAIPELQEEPDAGPLDDSRPWVTRWSPSGEWHVEVKGGPWRARNGALGFWT